MGSDARQLIEDRLNEVIIPNLWDNSSVDLNPPTPAADRLKKLIPKEAEGDQNLFAVVRAVESLEIASSIFKELADRPPYGKQGFISHSKDIDAKISKLRMTFKKIARKLNNVQS